MVNWGLAAHSATATAIFMIMFTSSSTIVQFALLGRLSLDISLIFWFTGFAGGFVGSKIISNVIKKIGRQSFVTFFLATIIVASGVCMCSVVILQMLGVFDKPTLKGEDFCEIAANSHR